MKNSSQLTFQKTVPDLLGGSIRRILVSRPRRTEDMINIALEELGSMQCKAAFPESELQSTAFFLLFLPGQRARQICILAVPSIGWIFRDLPCFPLPFIE